MQELTFETSLEKMDGILTEPAGVGARGNSRKCELHKHAMEAGKYKAFWRRAPSSIWLEHWEMNKD